MDATITLLRRLARREKVWEAHRRHFYQQADDHGFSALSVSVHVFVLNLALVGSCGYDLPVAGAIGANCPLLIVGIVFVGLVLWRFLNRAWRPLPMSVPSLR